MATAKKKSPKLTADKRRQLKTSEFALPGRDPSVKGAKGTYPMDTPGRAAAALGKATRFASPAQKAVIKKRVAAKYPSMGTAGAARKTAAKKK